jgi:hypothetical protein
MVDYTSWLKKIKINIPGSIDGVLTDISVPVKLFWTPFMQRDFKDIRFSSVGITPTKYEYCIVNKVDGSYANFLVKIPNLPKNPQSLDMNIYWGNPNVTSESNPDAVYLLYDHFENPILNSSKWNLDGGQISMLNSIATIINSAGDWLNISSKKIDFTDNLDIEMKVKKLDDNLRIGVTTQYSISDGSVLLFYKGSDWMGILSCLDNVCDQSVEFNISNLDDFHIVNLKLVNGIVKGFLDGIPQGNSSVNIPNPPYRFMIGNNNSVCYLDYVKILKTTLNPPTPIRIGSQYVPATCFIQDVNGNKIKNLFFETGYPGSVNTKVVELVIGDFSARNVQISCVDVDPNSLPPSMQNSSVNSSEYMQLSSDNINFYDILNLDLLLANSITDLFVKCTVPPDIMSGNFMCSLKVELEM